MKFVLFYVEQFVLHGHILDTVVTLALLFLDGLIFFAKHT